MLWRAWRGGKILGVMQQSEIIISEQCNIMFIFWTGKYAKTKCNSLHLVYLRPAPHFWSGFVCQALTRQAEIAATLIAVWTYGDEGRRTPDGLCTDVEARVFIDGFLQAVEEQSASLSACSRPQTFTALLKVIPLFTGYIAVCIPAVWECLTKRFGPNPFKLFGSLCLRCVYLAMKWNQETLRCTWS